MRHEREKHMSRKSSFLRRDVTRRGIGIGTYLLTEDDDDFEGVQVEVLAYDNEVPVIAFDDGTQSFGVSEHQRLRPWIVAGHEFYQSDY